MADSEIVAELREASRACNETSKDATQCVLRLRYHLNRYYPQLLQLGWELSDRVMLDLLRLVPCPVQAAETSVKQIQKVLGDAANTRPKRFFRRLRGLDTRSTKAQLEVRRHVRCNRPTTCAATKSKKLSGTSTSNNCSTGCRRLNVPSKRTKTCLPTSRSRYRYRESVHETRLGCLPTVIRRSSSVTKSGCAASRSRL